MAAKPSFAAITVYSLSSLLLTVFAATINNNNNYNSIDNAVRTTYLADATMNLPFGIPSAMLEDLPGAPLSPTDFSYVLPMIHDNPLGLDDQDPIELAGAFEGDIVFANIAELSQMTQPQSMRADKPRNAVIQPDRVWSNKEIPYVISSTYSREERGTIAVGMRNFHLETCIKFVPRTTQKDYIHIYKGQGCSSSVGRVGGHQSVSLGVGCIYVGIVMHELMHAAGFWHEQSRFDRDNYIRIYWSNIKDGMEFNFQKYDWNTISHLDLKYDLGSIMHYGPKSFAKDRSRKTIEALNGATIGQRRAFSKRDVEKLRKLYKCHETTHIKVTTTRPITTGGGGSSGGSSGGNSQCKNNYDEGKCSVWSSSGQCDQNPDWMLPNCKKSCNTCENKCTNLNANCEYWAKKSQCTQNTAYMHLYCKKSCGLCHAPSDDTNECADKNEFCTEWAASGTCHTNTDYMVTYCKKSCTDCVPTA